MQSVIWRHFNIDVPDDWEMLLHSRSLDTGRNTFADRYQHRMQFSWKVVPGPPDFERMMLDYGSALRAHDEQNEYIQKLKIGQWHGIVARVGDVLTSRFVAHFADEACLLELVFLWPEKRQTSVERQIVQSISVVPEHNGLQQWKAFGMNSCATADLPLASCTIQPGLAVMKFYGNKTDQRRETFERRGLVSQWLQVPVNEWLRRRVPPEIRIKTQVTETVQDHEIHIISGDTYAFGPARLLGKRVKYLSCAWICPSDGRLYNAEFRGNAPAADPAAIWERFTCLDIQGGCDEKR